MGTQISGKNSYAYVGGSAVVNLKNWTHNLDASPIDLDPNIGDSRIPSVAGFLKDTGSIDFNVTSDDFNDLWDAVVAATAVSLYLYTSTAASSIYLYGSAILTGISHDQGGVTGTVSGTCTYQNANSTGFSRQTTAS